MTAKEMLAEARDLVRRGWARGARAEDEAGNLVEPWSLLARRWSALGALEAVWRWSQAPELARGELERATLALSAVVGEIADWNDALERTEAEVVAAFERAIDLLDSDDPPSAEIAA